MKELALDIDMKFTIFINVVPEAPVRSLQTLSYCEYSWQIFYPLYIHTNSVT